MKYKLIIILFYNYIKTIKVYILIVILVLDYSLDIIFNFIIIIKSLLSVWTSIKRKIKTLRAGELNSGHLRDRQVY